MKKTLVGGAIAFALAASTLLIAAPASAADLPAGDQLWGLSCNNDEPMWGLTISTTDAVGTVVGTGSSTIESTCAGPGAVDPTTGIAYFISWGEEGLLAKFDPTTGDSTAVGNFSIDDEDEGIYPDGLAIGLDGLAYVTWNGDFFSLDLDSGDLTFITTIAGGYNDFYGFAVDPTSGIFYAVDIDGDAFTVVPGTGVFTPIGTITLPESETSIWALQIDSNGTWWIENDGVNADIWSLTLDGFDGGATLSGVLTVAGEQFYVESLLILPTAEIAPVIPAEVPALAATGSDATLTMSMVGIAFLLVAGGATFATIGRKRRIA